MSNLSAVLTWKHPTTVWSIRDNIVVDFPGGIPDDDTLRSWTNEYETRLAIINQIEALESTATPRRIREMAADPAWMNALDAQISALRAKL